MLPVASKCAYLRVCLYIFLAAFSSASTAAEWDYAARGGLSSNYDSNPTLNNDDDNPESTFRFLGFYEMDIETRKPNSNFSISPRVSRDYYPDSDKSDLESTDYDVPGQYSYALPTSRWNVSFGTSHKSILSSESIADTGGTVNAFRADDTVDNYRVSPNVVWTPTLKDQFQLGASWSKQDYDLDFTGRSDYEVYGFNTNYLRSLSERHSVGFSGVFSHSDSEGLNCRTALNYDPSQPARPNSSPCSDINLSDVNVFLLNVDGTPVTDTDGNFVSVPVERDAITSTNSNNADNYSLSLDYTFNWSETANLTVSAGRSRTKTEQTVKDENGNTMFETGALYLVGTEVIPVVQTEDKIKSDSKNETYKVQFRKSTERSDYRFSANRGTSLANSTGTPQQKDEFRFDMATDHTERLSTDLVLSYFEQESIFFAADDDESDVGGNSRKTKFYNGEFRVRYKLTSKWSVSSGYRYRHRNRDSRVNSSDTIESTSNQIRFAIIYTFKRLPN